MTVNETNWILSLKTAENWYNASEWGFSSVSLFNIPWIALNMGSIDVKSNSTSIDVQEKVE